MARLALSIAGGIIGGILGALTFTPFGVMAGIQGGLAIGGMAGAVLFPPKLPTNYGPRIGDKLVTSSAAGQPIPFGYGGFRIGGNIIWANQIKEIKTTQTQSAKGGPSQTSVTYTYTCSFAVAFCEGPADILRIWADSKLIYDTSGKTAVTLDTGIKDSGGTSKTVKFTPTIYKGTSTQMPDPTIESFLGVGNTPGYRDMVYAVFTDFPLADFGNRIPSMRAEISTGNVLAYVKDAYPAIGIVEDNGTGSPTVHPAHDCVVDSVNRIAYFFESHQQAVMAIDLNVDSTTPLTGWTANNVQNLGDQILDSNGNVQYVVSVTGDQKTGGSAPTWATSDSATTADHHVTWMKVGVGPNAVTVLRKGLLDPTTAAYSLYSPANYGQGPPNVVCVDTRGNLWGTAILVGPGASPYAQFAVRYDPISFKATGLFNANVFNTVPPGILSITPTKVGGKDLIYVVTVSTTGALEQLHIVDARTLQLQHTGMLALSSLFTTPPDSYRRLANTVPQPAIDPNTGIFYYILADSVNPGGLSTWYLMKVDPRQGNVIVPVPSWGKNAGQWRQMQTLASFPITTPTSSSDGYPAYCLYDGSDNTVLCFTVAATAKYSVIKKIDAVSGAQLATTNLTGYAYSTDSNIAIYGPVAYRGQCPTSGILKILSFDNKHIEYISCSDLTTIQSVPLNNWETGLGTGSDFFFGFAFDEASDSAIVTPSSYSPLGLRIFFDRKNVAAEPLDQVVIDILNRCEVDSANIDASALSSILCQGYVVARTADARACLQPLCMTYFFDLVETDFKIKAVLRGQTASQNIPEADLGIETDKIKLTETIAQEQDIPKTVSVEYIDPRLNYQTGKQHKYRRARVKKTKNHDILQLPVVLQGEDAAQIADKYLAMIWAERNMYDLKLWRSKYLVVDPTDVVQFTYQGLPFQARIVKHSLGQNKLLEISGVSEDARQYLSTLNGADTQGFNNQSLQPAGATLLFFLDTNLLQDVDANDPNTGFYYLMSSPTLSSWPGASLYQSADGNDFGLPITTDFDEAVYGVVVNPISDVDFGNGVLHPFSWDFTTQITIRLGQGTLSSTTELAVLNGANACIIGGEVIQFQYATLNGDGTYTLSKLLRGRRGTEEFCHFHGSGETFLLLNGATHRVTQSSSVIGLLRYYKAVTFGTSVASASSIPATVIGRDLMPYAPAQFTGAVDGSNNLNLSWVRRTRVGGAWVDGTGEVPLNEGSEAYDVDIMVLNNGGKRRIPYKITPSTDNPFFNNIFGVGQVPASALYTAAPVNPYDIVIKPFTITWDDGVVASYAFGQSGEGLRFTVGSGGGGVVAATGVSVWVRDPNRLGTNSVFDFGFDNNALPDNFTANTDGYYQITFVPGTNNFPSATPASTIWLHAVAGDAAIRSFDGLTGPNVLYTAAQIVNDFGRNEFTAFGAPGYVRARVFQRSSVIGRGYAAENPTAGLGNIVSGGSDATSILGVPITGSPLDGDILQYNQSANEWQIVGPAFKAVTVTKTTASLANGAIEQGFITVNCKSFILLSTGVDNSARVELYDTNANATADAGRAIGVPPEPLTQNGIMADHSLTAGGAETFNCTPPLVCTNHDSPRASKIYYRITNNSGSTNAITATLVIVPLEL
jgi:Putative phage tail protein